MNQRDLESEKRLRKDLKRTKALLADAQIMLDHLKNNAPSKREIAQLKNQVPCSEPTGSRGSQETHLFNDLVYCLFFLLALYVLGKEDGWNVMTSHPEQPDSPGSLGPTAWLPALEWCG